MKAVRTRLGRHVNLRSLAAEFSRVDSALHFELLQRVHGWKLDIEIKIRVGIFHTVQSVVIPGAPHSAQRDILLGACSALAPGSLRGGGKPVRHIRTKGNE